MADFFDTSIEFIKGVGPQRAKLLGEELSIFSYNDLLQHYPFRYEDRTRFYKIAELNDTLPAVQFEVSLVNLQTVGNGRRTRLVATAKDETGRIELVWFKGVSWMAKKLQPGVKYLVFGKPTKYGSKLNIAHPEIEIVTTGNSLEGKLRPVYSTTEKLKAKYIDSKTISKFVAALIQPALQHIHDPLPQEIAHRLKLMPKAEAIYHIHFPQNTQTLEKARFRLKFEELFYVQIQLLSLKSGRARKFKGKIYDSTELLTKFYNRHLPFELTGAQKRVIKEIYRDMKSGVQMNRLLQGDVGSGKTIVAFICMLVAIGGGSQAAMMAPTEILAEQHYEGLRPFAKAMGLQIAKLTGSTKASERKKLYLALETGVLNILVGTHALLEEKVKFNELGLAIVDEQHRFGVAQRSKLWSKNVDVFPHVLVMTATPIPRTLAMTLYGDLDVSIIDELPAGRKPIKTVHHYDSHRLKVNGFIKKQIEEGRQVYIVYPLIEESEKTDMKDLTDGYESIRRAFPEYHVSILHGRMKSEDKAFEMERFVKGETHIMVATTVIEVGVNVPNASVMVIENAERFGLAQLHQLRGRVGRGSDQSYCILMTDVKLSADARTRISTMVKTNNGFEIADTDLKLRGPGDLMGTQQSGVLDLKLADLAKDGAILKLARDTASQLISEDSELIRPEHHALKAHLQKVKQAKVNWSAIS
ncbi:MAG: ATP-dependent DNA helicase RecG [Cyclobacteriaceae bacterium]|nr:ATP-dependent DNA helicase RecG [Cyclobacteriaceae bacterium]